MRMILYYYFLLPSEFLGASPELCVGSCLDAGKSTNQSCFAISRRSPVPPPNTFDTHNHYLEKQKSALTSLPQGRPQHERLATTDEKLIQTPSWEGTYVLRNR